MTDAQFDEVFEKLKNVIASVIKTKEYKSITGEIIYNKFYDKFDYTSPVIKSAIKSQQSRIINLFNQNIEQFKDFSSYHTENVDNGARTIINFIVDVANDGELERQWERYKSKLLRGGKLRKGIKNKNKTKKIQLNKKNTTKKHKWSQKYKNSINCRRPKGFSQKQHCKYGRKK
jgi:hypothetical protein